MKTISCFVLALVLGASGCSQAPAPFDPGAECPKVAYCGQCASHGACAWCGDPGDLSKGQCVAVGHSECSAPSAWSKTPDHCPAPPPDAVASSTSEPATTSSSPATEAVGPEKFAAIKHALSRAFPHANVTDSVVASIVEVLVQRRSLGPGGGLKAEQREAAPVTKHVQEKEHRLYFGYRHKADRAPSFYLLEAGTATGDAKMDLAVPLELTADAGSRVALIAKTMGLSSAVELQDLLAEIARGLMWQQYPHYESPAPPAGASAEAPPTH